MSLMRVLETAVGVYLGGIFTVVFTVAVVQFLDRRDERARRRP